MSNPTTPFGWQMPENTDLVTDLPADFEVFGQAVATSMTDLLGGTTGQLLSKTSNTDMDFTWTTPNAADITGVTAGTGISGGGTSGDVTITNSMATAIDAKGDLVAGTGADAFSRLAVGANDTVLVADSSTATGLKWATPAAGGMTLISETVASALSSLSFTGIANTYKELYLVWEGIVHSASGNNFDIRLNNDSSGIYAFGVFGAATNNSGGLVFDADQSASATSTVGASSRYATFGDDGSGSGLDKNSMGWLRISNYASASKLKHYYGNWWNYDNSGGNTGRNACVGQGVYGSTSAITSVDIVRIAGAGTFSNATNTSIRLYGLL